MEQEAEHPFVQKGYDAWTELWVNQGCTPTASQCPARYMKDGSAERNAYIQGWNNAKREHNGEPK